MKRNTYLALLTAVAIPFAAIAQAQTTQDPATDTADPVLKSDTAKSADTQAAEKAAPADETMKSTDQAAEEPASDAMESDEQMAEQPKAADDKGTETALAGENAIDGPFVTVPQTGAWRVTDLEGKNVDDAKGESIGDISDVLVNEKGEVIAVLVGVGGFLGIGQKDVAVSMSALQFGPGKTEGLKTKEQRDQERAAEAQSQVPATGTGGTMGGTGANPDIAAVPQIVDEDPVVGDDNLPDRIVLNVTREELEAAPAYDDVEEGIDTGETAATGIEEPIEPVEAEPAD